MKRVCAFYCDSEKNINLRDINPYHVPIAEIRRWDSDHYRFVTYYPLAAKGVITHDSYKGEQALEKTHESLLKFAEQRGYRLIPIKD